MFLTEFRFSALTLYMKYSTFFPPCLRYLRKQIDKQMLFQRHIKVLIEKFQVTSYIKLEHINIKQNVGLLRITFGDNFILLKFFSSSSVAYISKSEIKYGQH